MSTMNQNSMIEVMGNLHLKLTLSLCSNVWRSRFEYGCSSIKEKGNPIPYPTYFQGCNLFGVFMRNWTDDSFKTPCRSETDWQDVQDVCNHLSIPCERVYLLLSETDVDRPESGILDRGVSTCFRCICFWGYAKSGCRLQ